MALIHEAISAIMSEVGSIGKDRKNVQQGYKFRGIDDVYMAVHPLLVKYGVFSVPRVTAERSEERTTKGGGALIYRVLTIEYTFFAKDGSSIMAVVIGEGMDSGDKASNKAMSVAHKYAILQLLAIPTEEQKDPEYDSPEPAPKSAEQSMEQSVEYPTSNPIDQDPRAKEIISLCTMMGKQYSYRNGLWKLYKGDLDAILEDVRREARALEAKELEAR